MDIKLLALACPVVLFVFKYLLPSFAEEAFSNKRRARGQAIIEFIHFPVDLLFVAISYTIWACPNIILKHGIDPFNLSLFLFFVQHSFLLGTLVGV